MTIEAFIERWEKMQKSAEMMACVTHEKGMSEVAETLLAVLKDARQIDTTIILGRMGQYAQKPNDCR